MQQPPKEFIEWYSSLKFIKANNGPAKGTISTALVLLKRLTTNYDLDFNNQVTKGGMQIRGVTGRAVNAILRSFGENREFSIEGGRTNRGGPAPIKALLSTLKFLQLENLDISERNEKINLMLLYLVERVRDYHNKQKIKLSFNPTFSTWYFIHNLLKTTIEDGKGGYIAQHLVGAKLQLRFPQLKVSNERASAADVQTQRHGDFLIGDTTFHVTIAPNQLVYEKCKRNISQGLKPFLLVPDEKLIGTRQNTEQECSQQIAVESIESFVSQNINEISSFDKGKLTSTIYDLIQLFNKRVDQVETDKSLLIELPSNLK